MIYCSCCSSCFLASLWCSPRRPQSCRSMGWRFRWKDPRWLLCVLATQLLLLSWTPGANAQTEFQRVLCTRTGRLTDFNRTALLVRSVDMTANSAIAFINLTRTPTYPEDADLRRPGPPLNQTEEPDITTIAQTLTPDSDAETTNASLLRRDHDRRSADSPDTRLVEDADRPSTQPATQPATRPTLVPKLPSDDALADPATSLPENGTATQHAANTTLGTLLPLRNLPLLCVHRRTGAIRFEETRLCARGWRFLVLDEADMG
eukprot:m.646033 g.646033  ORF g.646033 m.646033 type:complete len:262 (+) comp58362_c0_seq20:870-1655(+)